MLSTEEEKANRILISSSDYILLCLRSENSSLHA